MVHSAVSYQGDGPQEQEELMWNYEKRCDLISGNTVKQMRVGSIRLRLPKTLRQRRLKHKRFKQLGA